MYNLAWAVVLIPLGASLFSYLPEAPRRAAQVCSLGTAVSLVLAVVLMLYRLAHNTSPYQSVITFFTFSPNQDLGGGVVGDFHPQLGVRVDGLSAVMLPVVALISLLVQVHSVGSMRGDPGLRRYAALLSLCTFALLGVVASPNYFGLLVMWLLVSVCSWLLVGHWWHLPESLRAVRRAFLVTHVGDVALLLAVIFGFVKFAANVALLPPTPGQDVNDPFSFSILGNEWHRAHLGAVAGVGVRSLVVLAVLLLVAAVAKSAQLPLQSWLADTTEGPLPAAALIQSAGVATIGALLIARSYPLFVEVPQVLAVLAVIGGATAVAGAMVALAHTDLPRIIAHLTYSQLGLVFVALGVGALSGGMFHLFTRAWIVALLSLSAANVVRVYGTRDLRQIGGVWRRMRWTAWGLVVGGAASAGVLLLSGFWSQDAVLAGVLRNRLPSGGQAPAVVQGLLVLAVLAAVGLGAVAAVRVVALTCLGEPPRRRGFQPERVREVSDSMRLPVGALAVLAAVVGLVGIQGIRPTFGNVVFAGGAPQHEPFSAAAFVLTALLGLGGAGAAWTLWARRDRAAVERAERVAPLGRLLTGAAFQPLWARALDLLVVRPSRLPPWVDDHATEPVVDAVGEGLEVAAATSRWMPGARLSAYLITAVAGMALLALGVTLAATGHLPGVGASR